MSTKMSYRYAERKDVQLILKFIKDLAHFEHLEKEVVATPELLEIWLFERKKAEVIFAMSEDGQEVGFALFFHNFSTFLGRAGLYLEDLFVIPEYRKLGYGKFLLKTLAQIALERECGRLELSCLDWNMEARNFYQKHGAQMMDDWTTHRFTGLALENLSNI